MFLKTSRYNKTETLVAEDSKGRSVEAIKIRELPDTSGVTEVVDNSHKLDVMSERLYKDGTRFWHIADANSELEAGALLNTPGETVKVPDA